MKTSFFKNISLIHSFLVSALIVVLFLLSSHLWFGDVLFHTDVARDFLVMAEMVETGNPTLIGPRSGGIEGVFHGPAWYYVSIVPFWLSDGHPVLMGWFWWLLATVAALVFLVTCWLLSRDLSVSLLATLGYILLLGPESAGPINPFPANLFSFLVFLTWWKWYQKPNWLLASLGWLGLGSLIQLQMAFAVPLIVVWIPLFSWRLWQLAKSTRQIKPVITNLLTVAILMIPLSTFLVFDLRHDWLQTKSVLSYVSQGSGHQTVDLSVFTTRVVKRSWQAITEGLNLVRLPGWSAILMLPIWTTFGWIGWRRGPKPTKLALLGLASIYAGWWLITLIFRGEIWPYYYTAFFGMGWLVLALTAKYSQITKLLLATMVLVLAFQARQELTYEPSRFNSSSWKLLSTIASDQLTTIPPHTDQATPIGYFVYHPNQFGYALKYAFTWETKQQGLTEIISPFEKHPQTLLVKAPDDPNNPYISATDWQTSKLGIPVDLSPISSSEYPFGYTAELYQLPPEIRNAPVDPNLITDLHFR